MESVMQNPDHLPPPGPLPPQAHAHHRSTCPYLAESRPMPAMLSPSRTTPHYDPVHAASTAHWYPAPPHLWSQPSTLPHHYHYHFGTHHPQYGHNQGNYGPGHYHHHHQQAPPPRSLNLGGGPPSEQFHSNSGHQSHPQPILRASVSSLFHHQPVLPMPPDPLPIAPNVNPSRPPYNAMPPVLPTPQHPQQTRPMSLQELPDDFAAFMNGGRLPPNGGNPQPTAAPSSSSSAPSQVPQPQQQPQQQPQLPAPPMVASTSQPGSTSSSSSSSTPPATPTQRPQFGSAQPETVLPANRLGGLGPSTTTAPTSPHRLHQANWYDRFPFLDPNQSTGPPPPPLPPPLNTLTSMHPAPPPTTENRRGTTRRRAVVPSRHLSVHPYHDSEDEMDEMTGETALHLFEAMARVPLRHGEVDEDRIRQHQILRGTLTSKRVASRSALSQLQSVEISSLSESERSCVICYNDYGVPNPEGINEAPLRLPKCKHVFGDHCIKKWFEESDSCPYCRDKVPSESYYTRNPQSVQSFWQHQLTSGRSNGRASVRAEATGAYIRYMRAEGRTRPVTLQPGDDGLSTTPPRANWQTSERRSPPSDGGERARRTRPRHGSMRSSPPSNNTNANNGSSRSTPLVTVVPVGSTALAVAEAVAAERMSNRQQAQQQSSSLRALQAYSVPPGGNANPANSLWQLTQAGGPRRSLTPGMPRYLATASANDRPSVTNAASINPTVAPSIPVGPRALQTLRQQVAPQQGASPAGNMNGGSSFFASLAPGPMDLDPPAPHMPQNPYHHHMLASSVSGPQHQHQQQPTAAAPQEHHLQQQQQQQQPSSFSNPLNQAIPPQQHLPGGPTSVPTFGHAGLPHPLQQQQHAHQHQPHAPPHFAHHPLYPGNNSLPPFHPVAPGNMAGQGSEGSAADDNANAWNHR